MPAPKLVARMGLDTKQFRREVRQLKRSLGSMSRDLTAVGRGLTAGLTLPLIAGLGTAGKAFFDFDASMTKSLAIMGNVSDSMKEDMSAAARQVALDTKFSAEQAGESYFFLASAGLDAAQSIGALPKVSKFAQAGAFDMALATDLLTDAQSALGLTVKDTADNTRNMARVSDVLVKANTLANASVQQFSEALTMKAGAAMRQLGMDVEEGVAVLAAFADQGRKGSEAGTQFSIVLRDLQTKSIKFRDEFEKAGITVFDAQGEFRPMSDILKDLERNLEGASDEQKKLTLLTLGFSDKSVSALLSLIGLSDKIAGYEKGLRSAGGTTDEVATKQLAGLQGVWQRLTSGVGELKIAMGEQLMPTFERLATFITEKVLPAVSKGVKWFADLPAPVQNAALAATALAAAIGPLLLVIGTLVSALVPLAPAILAVVTVLTGPVGIVIALAAATAAVVGFFTHLKTESGALQQRRRELKMTQESIDKLAEREGNLSGVEKAHLQIMRDRKNGLVAQIAKLEDATGATEDREAAAREGIDADIAYLESTANTTTAIADNTTAAQANADALVDEVVPAIEATFTPLKEARDHWIAYQEKLDEIVSDRQWHSAWSSEVQRAADGVRGKVDDLTADILSKWQYTWSDEMKPATIEGMNDVRQAIYDHEDGLTEAGESAGTSLVDGLKEIWTGENIGATFARAFEGGGGFMGGIKSTLTQIGTNVATHFTGVLGGALNMVPLVGPLLAQFAPALIAGIGQLAGKVWGAIKRLFGGPDAKQIGRRDTYHGFREQAEQDLADVSRYQELVNQQLAEGQDRNIAHAKAAFGYYAEQAGKTWHEGYLLHDRFLGAVKAGNQSTMDSILTTVTTWQASAREATESVTEDLRCVL